MNFRAGAIVRTKSGDPQYETPQICIIPEYESKLLCQRNCGSDMCYEHNNLKIVGEPYYLHQVSGCQLEMLTGCYICKHGIGYHETDPNGYCVCKNCECKKYISWKDWAAEQER